MNADTLSKSIGFIGTACILQAIVAGICWGFGGVLAAVVISALFILYIGAVARQGIGVSIFALLGMVFWFVVMMLTIHFIWIGFHGWDWDHLPVWDPWSEVICKCMLGENAFWWTFLGCASLPALLLLAGRAARKC